MKLKKGIPVIDQGNKLGFWGGKFGGNFVPETLKKPINDLEVLFDKLKNDKRFLQERGFPEQQLGTYQGFVSGASPFLRTTQTTMGPQQFQPSPIASALGTIGTGLGTFKAAQDLNLFSNSFITFLC